MAETRTLPALTDPRIDLDDRALTLASRNAFPVVASRVRRRDGFGLAAGAGAALLLGGATFWSLSEHRTAPPPTPGLALPPAPVARPAAAPLPIAIPAAAITPVATDQRLAAPPAPMTASAPVMVYDTSASDAAPDAPRAAAAAAARPGSPQPLNENESFAGRIGEQGVDTASASRMVDPATTVTQGTLIPAVLETAINSDLPGYVRALVSEDVRSFDGSHVLIPRSSRLIGQYKSGLAAGQTRAYVLWTRLIRPDGVSVALASPGTDFAGETGLAGQVDGHFMKRFGSAMLLSVVGGVGALGSSGTSLVLSTGGQSAASVAAQRDAQIPPTIRVRQGQPIRIFTARDLDFSTVAESGQ
jgi:type IV secretion system protein VirB10